jgi:hypothetical protein
MSDPSLEVQGALVAALKAASIGVDARIYDDVPADRTFPYVSLGECQVLPDKADCIDGAELFLQVDAWSREVGFPEVKGIAAKIVDALDDRPLSVSGHNVVVFEHQSTQYLRDPDGLTHHAALTFRALVQPS